MKRYKVTKDFWILSTMSEPLFGDGVLIKKGSFLEETGIVPPDSVMKDTHVVLKIMPCGEKALFNKGLFGKCIEEVRDDDQRDS